MTAGKGAQIPAADIDVVIVGAGPVGLTLANVLGLQGVRTLIVEERDSLIDYPRGVGLDDESLRTFQAIGLALTVKKIAAQSAYQMVWPVVADELIGVLSPAHVF